MLIFFGSSLAFSNLVHRDSTAPRSSPAWERGVVFLFFQFFSILGDPGAVSGDGEKSKTGEKKIRAKKLRPNFFSPVLDFSPSPLTAPGSPRMIFQCSLILCSVTLVPVGRARPRKIKQRFLKIFQVLDWINIWGNGLNQYSKYWIGSIFEELDYINFSSVGQVLDWINIPGVGLDLEIKRLNWTKIECIFIL